MVCLFSGAGYYIELNITEIKIVCLFPGTGYRQHVMTRFFKQHLFVVFVCLFVCSSSSTFFLLSMRLPSFLTIVTAILSLTVPKCPLKPLLLLTCGYSELH